MTTKEMPIDSLCDVIRNNTTKLASLDKQIAKILQERTKLLAEMEGALGAYCEYVRTKDVSKNEEVFEVSSP